MEYHKALVRKILVDWGFDGLKLDGQDMNGVPACYNPAHHHAQPEDSVEALPDFFRAIYDTAQSVKPGALVEFCPCGTGFSFFTMPHFNMSVASDPEKFLSGSFQGEDLESPDGRQRSLLRRSRRTQRWRQRLCFHAGGGRRGGNAVCSSFSGSEEEQIRSDSGAGEGIRKVACASIATRCCRRGQYLGQLYDIGFDVPETHVIRKDQTMYYAFFAKQWKGTVELRGLENRNYSVVDYVTGKNLGTVSRTRLHICRLSSTEVCLLEVRPQ